MQRIAILFCPLNVAILSIQLIDANQNLLWPSSNSSKQGMISHQLPGKVMARRGLINFLQDNIAPTNRTKCHPQHHSTNQKTPSPNKKSWPHCWIMEEEFHGIASHTELINFTSTKSNSKCAQRHTTNTTGKL